MARPPRIAVVGSANADLVTFGEAFPRPGETVFGRDFKLNFGGKGANQAIAARSCGAEVIMVACVGDDLFGKATLANFRSCRIDVTHVRVEADAPTGVAPIFVDPAGENRIIVVKGANDRLSGADVDAASSALQDADLIIVQFEIPLETVYRSVRFAREHQIPCIINPAPAIAADLSRLTEIDYLIPNESEAELITGMQASTLEEAGTSAEALLAKGFRKVILTLGERGSLIAGTGIKHHVLPYSVTAVDTTGAGDAFIGSFAVFLAEGISENEAAARANLYAALSTTRPGAQKSFLTRSEFDAEWARRRHGTSAS
jgi:ribokinase